MKQRQHDDVRLVLLFLPEQRQVQCNADAARQHQACAALSPEQRQVQREADAARYR